MLILENGRLRRSGVFHPSVPGTFVIRVNSMSARHLCRMLARGLRRPGICFTFRFPLASQ
jgi:hypothetical protein